MQCTDFALYKSQVADSGFQCLCTREGENKRELATELTNFMSANFFFNRLFRWRLYGYANRSKLNKKFIYVYTVHGARASTEQNGIFIILQNCIFFGFLFFHSREIGLSKSVTQNKIKYIRKYFLVDERATECKIDNNFKL